SGPIPSTVPCVSARTTARFAACSVPEIRGPVCSSPRASTTTSSGASLMTGSSCETAGCCSAPFLHAETKATMTNRANQRIRLLKHQLEAERQRGQQLLAEASHPQIAGSTRLNQQCLFELDARIDQLEVRRGTLLEPQLGDLIRALRLFHRAHAVV